jgi:hypothetical protein
MHCPPDDDSFQQLASNNELELKNFYFSDALCSELRKSGSANLTNVDDCALNFFMGTL